MSVKEKVKKHSVTLALCTMITAGFTSYTQYLKSEDEKQKARSDNFEIFFSDYQDKIQCALDSIGVRGCH